MVVEVLEVVLCLNGFFFVVVLGRVLVNDPHGVSPGATKQYQQMDLYILLIIRYLYLLRKIMIAI